MRWRVAAVAALVTLSACRGGGGVVTTLPAEETAQTPTAAVETLVGAISEGEFSRAASLVVPGQAALASLAEGASFGEVASAIRDGDTEVAANFWSGFAQGAGTFLTEEVTAEEGGIVEQGGVVFHEVMVAPAEGAQRRILVREGEGYRIDLFASFGHGLADKMIPVVERLLTTGTQDSRLILASLQEIVPSLLVAARAPSITPEVSQQLLALIEVITRVG